MRTGAGHMDSIQPSEGGQQLNYEGPVDHCWTVSHIGQFGRDLSAWTGTDAHGEELCTALGDAATTEDKRILMARWRRQLQTRDVHEWDGPNRAEWDALGDWMREWYASHDFEW